MFKTKEIRWFFESENLSIENWFESMEFDAFEKRDDFYLHLGKEDVGIKLREGNIEVKHRIGTRSKGCAGTHAWGYFEHWLKWSFNAGSENEMLSDITDGKNERWCRVSKERKSVLMITENGDLSIVPPESDLAYGCQIEYSKIRVNGEKWYTFGLEWFGDRCMEIDPSLIDAILGNTKLNMNRSMGYPSFLLQLINDTERMLLESF